MKLHENKDDFYKNLLRTSNKFEINKEYVEKDYWLTLVLKDIFANDIDFVFKGGTSLSKCYHIIERFSEDIDIAYIAPYRSLSRNQIEKRFKRIERAIIDAELAVENNAELRRGRYFNQFRCSYPSLFDDDVIEKKVLVELAVQTPSYPNKKVYIQSFIGEYLDSINRHDLTISYGLEPFEVVTQSLERTFVDKTFAICDYYLSNNLLKHSRHIYDLYKISKEIELGDELHNLFKRVKESRETLPIALSSRGDKKLYEYLDELIRIDSFKEDYNKITINLLYEEVPYMTAIETIRKIQSFLKEHDF